MHGSGEDGAQHNPQQGGGAVKRAHDGAEHRTDARDVQKLNQPQLPFGHGHEVHAVGMGDCRSGTLGLGAENLFHKAAVNEVAHDEARGRDDEPHESWHCFSPVKQCFSGRAGTCRNAIDN